jgi:hypothetical protein
LGGGVFIKDFFFAWGLLMGWLWKSPSFSQFQFLIVKKCYFVLKERTLSLILIGSHKEQARIVIFLEKKNDFFYRRSSVFLFWKLPILVSLVVNWRFSVLIMLSQLVLINQMKSFFFLMSMGYVLVNAEIFEEIYLLI